MESMNIIQKRLDEITPYENNPRMNDAAVESVAESIRQFGFKNPILVDADGVIVAGHTRHKAAQKLGLETVPVIVMDDLTEEQCKAFRLADNRVAENSVWDDEKLKQELDALAEMGVDMEVFGFLDEVVAAAEALDLDDVLPQKAQTEDRQVCHCPKCGFQFEV